MHRDGPCVLGFILGGEIQPCGVSALLIATTGGRGISLESKHYSVGSTLPATVSKKLASGAAICYREENQVALVSHREILRAGGGRAAVRTRVTTWGAVGSCLHTRRVARTHGRMLSFFSAIPRLCSTFLCCYAYIVPSETGGW